MKALFIIRGIPGSGKSTLAKQLAGDNVFEADQYFLADGEYRFDFSKLGLAHESCKQRLTNAMSNGIMPLCVSNTTTTEKELNPYLELAKSHGYTAFVVVVENRHEGVNQHGVPEEVLTKMRARLAGSIKL